MKYFVLIFFATGVLIAFNCNLYAEKVKFDLVLCKDVAHNLPDKITTRFSTDTKIYAYLYLDRIDNGKHTLRFDWYNPGGKLQESHIEQALVTEKAYNIWSWIKLKEAKFVFDSSFIGRWKIKIFINGKFLVEKYFNII